MTDVLDLTELPAGSRNYRAWVGPAGRFDTLSALQFGLLTTAGLRETHTLLDIGCGSLRAGRLFLAYLLPGHYFGIEPERWVLQEGIREMLGEQFIARRSPTFIHDDQFTLSAFGRQFDYLLAQSIFSHTTLEQMDRCLGEARTAMSPESQFFATFIPGESDYDGDEWVYPGIVQFKPSTVRAIAARHGLTMRRVAWPHPSQRWVVFRPQEAGNPPLPPTLRPRGRKIAKLQATVAQQADELQQQEQQLHRLRGRS